MQTTIPTRHFNSSASHPQTPNDIADNDARPLSTSDQHSICSESPPLHSPEWRLEIFFNTLPFTYWYMEKDFTKKEWAGFEHHAVSRQSHEVVAKMVKEYRDINLDVVDVDKLADKFLGFHTDLSPAVAARWKLYIMDHVNYFLENTTPRNSVLVERASGKQRWSFARWFG